MERTGHKVFSDKIYDIQHTLQQRDGINVRYTFSDCGGKMRVQRIKTAYGVQQTIWTMNSKTETWNHQDTTGDRLCAVLLLSLKHSDLVDGSFDSASLFLH